MATMADETTLSPNNRTLPLHGRRSMSESGDLCTECEAVYSSMLWPQPSPDDAEALDEPYVGWLDRLLATESCTLCQFITRIFFQVQDSIQQSDIADGRRVLCHLVPSGPLSSETGIALGLNITVNFTDFRVDGSDYVAPRSGFELYRPQIRLMLESTNLLVSHPDGYREGDKILSLARPLLQECSASFIRKSYETCLQEHGKDCEAPQNIFSQPTKRLSIESDRVYPSQLIDVMNLQVVTAEENSTYVALSYCWSKDLYLMLKRSNYEALRQKNGLDPRLLTPTIADAIRAVALMGERYLWVDSLCIVQDDDEMKMAEIRQMSTIYRHAAVTIVAATADTDGIDRGLPGIRPGSRAVQQVVADIRGFKFAASVPDLSTAIKASRWSSRQWTYQEHHLSKRELVFTPQQAFFVCRRDAFSEDYVKSACVHLEESAQTRDCCAYKTPLSFDDRTNVPDHGIVMYEALARDISTRSLSFESDALNAITGVLTAMSDESDASFLCGLPTHDILGRFALWLPKNALRRRIQGTFPSWSWIGRVGPVCYPVTGDTFDGKITHIDANLVPDDDISVIVPSSEGLDMTIDAKRDDRTNLKNAELQTISNAHLHFYAWTVEASVSSFVWGTFADCDTPASRCHAVVVDGSCGGLLIFDCAETLSDAQDLSGLTQADAWSRSTDDCNSFTLVALSKTYMPWMLYFPIDVDPNSSANFNLVDEDGEYLRDHFPFDATVWNEEDFQLVNFMVVETNAGIARRLGVGQMHEDAWKAVRPVHMPVTLG